MTDTRKIVLRNVRVRYPKLAEAAENRFADNGKRYYSAQFVIPTGDGDTRSSIVAGMKAAFSEKFGEKAPAIMKRAMENRNTRGLQQDEDLGAYTLNAKRAENRGAPVVFDRDRKEIVDPRDYPQGGDYVDAVIQAWCYDFNGNKGVSFELVSVRFREKGEPFAGQGLRASADDFEALDTNSTNKDSFDESAYM